MGTQHPNSGTQHPVCAWASSEAQGCDTGRWHHETWHPAAPAVLGLPQPLALAGHGANPARVCPPFGDGMVEVTWPWDR